MSGSSNGTEWVEATEEVVETEECLPTESNTEVQVMEEEKTPIQKLLDTVGQGDNAESDEGFCCEECLSLFQDQSDPENVGGPSFVLDFPTSMGVPQRALLTLPYGLTVGRSSIPNAGVGVINHGPAVSPGMHFGPYEGEVTSRESASGFFWEIRKDKDQYEYIDVARDSHSNWMRYVTCARSRDETNLLAVQYKGSILYHCCRTIHTGEELMVWPSSKLLRLCSEAWRQMWLLKSNTTDADSSLSSTSEVFQCSRCQLPFTTEVFLQCHSEMCHTQAGKSHATAAVDPGGDGTAAASLAVLSVDSAVSKTCGDCGKVFKQMPHLRRHKLCVHSNKRPFCCPLCRRSFSQASGLIRHHLVHRKQAALDAADPKQNGEEPSAVATPADAAVSEETDAHGDASEAVQTPAGEAETPPPNCSDCGTGFASEVSRKKPKATAHERLRPYVCTVCQKSFGQYHDLSRHLRSHQRQKKKWRDAKEDSEDPAAAAALPFSCAECSLTFSSVDALQQHVDERHSQEQPSEEVTEAVRHAAPQRPQRLGARSKVSAITKLIAPKRRAASPAPSEAEPPANGKSKKSRWFSCNRCKLTYGDPEDLRAHKCARLHNCGECAATFSKRGFLRRHEQSVHARKPFSCDRCEKVFTSSGNLKQHRKSNTCMKYHCTSELFPCSFCQFSFTLKSYLLKHIKRHHPMEYLSHCDSQSLANQLEEEEGEGEGEEEGDAAGGAGGEKQHVCPHCSRRCANATALKTHGCFRQVKIMYLCTDCGKGFTNHYSLKQHHRIHTGEKPYSCPHCSKSFAYVGQRNVHLRTHTGEKPYLCTHCGESFRQSGDLKRHERKHTGVRPHRCAECNKSFSRLQSLKAHQMLHRGQRIFKCSQCGKSFSRNYHLRRHHQKMHT